ncbi:hypothetical protein ACHQM5_030520 [Ranunculus cassubicifolius]
MRTPGLLTFGEYVYAFQLYPTYGFQQQAYPRIWYLVIPNFVAGHPQHQFHCLSSHLQWFLQSYNINISYSALKIKFLYFSNAGN